jgi:hypothetical protein
MSDADVEALLRSEGVEPDGVDALVEWARGRAAELIATTEGDPELGPLLREGGQAGADERSHGRRRARGEADEGEAPRRGRKRKAEERKRRGRGRAEKTEDEVADAEREPEEPPGEHERDEPDREPEWRATLHGSDPIESPPRSYEEEVTTPRGESSSAGPLPPVPSSVRSSGADGTASDEVEDIEEIDAEELEMIDEEVAAEPEQQPARETPTFGPPDGTDAVPAWKAALLAAETGSDREAAELIKKEESGVKPLPQSNTEPVIGERLEAEEDEISQHKIDLSDLDGSPEE